MASIVSSKKEIIVYVLAAVGSVREVLAVFIVCVSLMKVMKTVEQLVGQRKRIWDSPPTVVQVQVIGSKDTGQRDGVTTFCGWDVGMISCGKTMNTVAQELTQILTIAPEIRFTRRESIPEAVQEVNAQRIAFIPIIKKTAGRVVMNTVIQAVGSKGDGVVEAAQMVLVIKTAVLG